MDNQDYGTGSHLFLLRLWPGKQPGGADGWQGRVQHLASSEAGHFEDWPGLIALLEALLAGLAPDAPPPTAPVAAPPSAATDGTNTRI